jgi:hypothetical protein
MLEQRDNPQAGNFVVSNSQFGFTVTGASNMPVVVDVAANLSGPWTALQTFTLTNGAVNVSDTQSGGGSGRFYRFHSP